MYHITIIEGDDVLCTYLYHEFTDAGITVSTAHDGEAGLAEIQKAIPNLVLMDMLTTKKSGIEILQAMRNDPRTQTVPVMVMSMVATDDIIQKALQLGAIEYFVKSQHTVAEIVDKAMRFLKQGGVPVASRTSMIGATYLKM